MDGAIGIRFAVLARVVEVGDGFDEVGFILGAFVEDHVVIKGGAVPIKGEILWHECRVREWGRVVELMEEARYEGGARSFMSV